MPDSSFVVQSINRQWLEKLSPDFLEREAKMRKAFDNFAEGRGATDFYRRTSLVYSNGLCPSLVVRRNNNNFGLEVGMDQLKTLVKDFAASIN